MNVGKMSPQVRYYSSEHHAFVFLLFPVLKNTKETGDCDAVKYAKAIKKFKNSCVSKFSSCRKQEDAAVQLVYTCGDGEIEEDSSKSS